MVPASRPPAEGRDGRRVQPLHEADPEEDAWRARMTRVVAAPLDGTADLPAGARRPSRHSLRRGEVAYISKVETYGFKSSRR